MLKYWIDCFKIDFLGDKITTFKPFSANFAANKWGNAQGEEVHEIALNPEYLATQDVKRVMSTLVHEMCHLQQYSEGEIVRTHNAGFAERMEKVGLITSTTGKKGGKKTGKSMDHYIEECGLFDVVTDELLQQDEFKLRWCDTTTKMPIRSTESILAKSRRMNQDAIDAALDDFLEEKREEAAERKEKSIERKAAKQREKRYVEDLEEQVRYLHDRDGKPAQKIVVSWMSCFDSEIQSEVVIAENIKDAVKKTKLALTEAELVKTMSDDEDSAKAWFHAQDISVNFTFII